MNAVEHSSRSDLANTLRFEFQVSFEDLSHADRPTHLLKTFLEDPNVLLCSAFKGFYVPIHNSEV